MPYLFIPFRLFTNKPQADSVDRPYVVFFGLLLIPENCLRNPVGT